MIPQFTKTLEDFISTYKYYEEVEGVLTEKGWSDKFVPLLETIPNFTFEDENLGIDLDISFEKLFTEKYDLREIGAETDELFAHYLRETLNKTIIDYVPKIALWVNNFNDLFKFTVKLEYDESGSNSNGNKNTYYLQPTTSATPNLKVDNVDQSDASGSYSRNLDRDVLQTVWGKTRANILQQIMELENIYVKCLESLETCFMGLY